MLIKFSSDRVLIKGPKADNSYQVVFEVGEYEVSKIKDLVGVFDQVLEVEVNLKPWNKVKTKA